MPSTTNPLSSKTALVNDAWGEMTRTGRRMTSFATLSRNGVGTDVRPARMLPVKTSVSLRECDVLVALLKA